MSSFVPAVEKHLAAHPNERAAIARFVDLFEIRWANREHFDRSAVSAYLLKPKAHAAEIYGFERELLLVYSPYATLEPRTIKQFEDIISRPKLQGRTEPLYMVLIAPIPDIEAEVAKYRLDADQGRILIGFSEEELVHNPDPWLLRHRFSKCLFSRDLFDMKQALVADSYFFGRQALVLDLLDRVKRGENTGLYGLRKTGKTSVLFRLRRIVQTEESGVFVYLDAQNPDVYNRRWWELLSLIKDEAANAARVALDHPLDREFTERTAVTRTKAALIQILDKVRGTGKRLIIVVDEIEHIHPRLSAAPHWNEDFSPFWKLLRSIQTEDRRIAFIIAGVNSQVSETPTIERQDNPLFSLVGTRYLTPFAQHETKEMVQTLGRRMGVLFDADACNYLAVRYGGHPLLIRLACSWEHRLRTSSDYAERPVKITAEQLKRTQHERELELVYYVRHVLEVLRLWYREEYDILSLVATGDLAEFESYAKDLPDSVQHLRAYGLLAKDSATLSVGVIEQYLVDEGRRAQRGPTSAVSSEQAVPVSFKSNGMPDVAALIEVGECATVEFKSTLRTNLHTAQPDSRMEHGVLKTIAAFLNSAGGTLVIGLDDSRRAVGIDADRFSNEDKMLLHLGNLIRDRLGAEHAPTIQATFVDYDGKRLLVIACSPSPRPVFVRDGGDEVFYVRLLAATTDLTARQAQQFIASRFPLQ